MTSKTKQIFLAGIAILMFAPSNIFAAEGSSNDSAAISWDYYGEAGAENWGKIKGEFKDCRLGKYQSPIDIVPTIKAILPSIAPYYKKTPLEILNNGHTIQVNYPKGSKMIVGGVTYNLLQFHFHTGSENYVNGKQYDMEVHLVHATNEGQLGVLGIMIEEGRSNKTIENIWKYMPMEKSAAKTYSDVLFNVSALLPDSLAYYRFMGSLTTPPCTENVNWHVLKKPIQASKAQIDQFKKAFPMNARPLQPQNNRLIVNGIMIKQKITKEQK